MAKRNNQLTALYNETLREITSSPKAWMRFLASACWNYKCSFREQVLIYAQRPHATAVLELEKWNDLFGRWIRRGSSGIMLSDDSSGNVRIRYCFDISDTVETEMSKPVPIWSMDEQYTEELIKRLSGKYNFEHTYGNLEDIIKTVSERITADNLINFIDRLNDRKEGSRLAEINDLDLKETFRTAIENSIAYMTMSRCGMDTHKYLGEDAFNSILSFDTPKVGKELGAAANSIGKLQLREISSIVTYLQKDNPSWYNKNNNPERGNDNGDYLQKRRGLLHPEFDSSETTRLEQSGNVRPDETEISNGGETGAVRRPVHGRNSAGSSTGGSAASGRYAGEIDTSDGKGGRRNGGTEGERPDEVGRSDEQHSPLSRGNNSSGADIRLSKGYDDEGRPQFPRALVPEILNKSELLKEDSNQVFNFFAANGNHEFRINHIKAVFNKEFTGVIISNGKRVGYKAEDDYVYFWEGDFLSRTSGSVLSWADVCDEYSNMFEEQEPSVVKPVESPPPDDGVMVQLSLFPTADVQIEKINSSNESEVMKTSDFSISQDVIDHALQSGGHEIDSILYIVAHYQKEYPSDYSIDVLIREYGTGGKGFVYDGHKVSMWYDEKGIALAAGTTALRAKEHARLPWTDVDKRISQLLNDGRYVTAELLEKVHDHEISNLAVRFAELQRSLAEGESISQGLEGQIFSNLKEEIIEFLSDGNMLSAFTGSMSKFAKRYDADASIIEKRSPYRDPNYINPHYLLSRLEQLQDNPKHFEVADGFAPDFKMFITDDEVDRLLTSGGNVSQANYRIASYFLQEHSKKEKVTFLKDEYGWGGTSHTGFDEMHDSKGISYKREYMPDKKYEAGVFLKWPEVVKYIDTLIAENRYLSANDIKGIPSYEKEIVARGVYSFYYNQPMDVLRPYEDASDYRQAESSIRAQMANKKDIAGLLEGMEQVLDNTPDTDRHYDSMLEKYHDLQAYSEGTFTLFNNLDKKYADIDDDLRDALSNYVLTDGAKVIIDNLISSGEGNTNLQSYIVSVIQMGAETINLDTGETADLFISTTGIDLDIHDKYNTSISASWDEVINTIRLIHYQGWKSSESRNVIDSKDIGSEKEWVGTRKASELSKITDNKKQVIALYSTDMSKIAIILAPNGKYFNYYGYDKNSGRYDSNAGAFDSFEDAETALYSHRPTAKKLLEHDVEKIHVDESQDENADDGQADKISQDNAEETEIKEKQELETNKKPDKLEIGTELTIEGRKFVIDSVDENRNKVSLRDITFQNGMGYPIFRSESIDFVHATLAEQIADLPPVKADTDKTKANYSRALISYVHPEISQSERTNYRITNDALGHGGAKTKFRNNIDAIKLLHELDNEERLATPEEQEILAQYVGWGGLPQAFDEKNSSWSSEYIELKALIPKDEYASARATTLNAHYTSPIVIKSIYKALDNMGFSKGNILDPGCGIGNFQGLLPDSMSDSQVIGVEIDPITGRIAQQLYQNNSIIIDGYEKTNIPDSFFDIAVGNVPFGAYSVSDKRYDRHKFYIHDYFIAKTLDKIRPGGIIAVITTKGTLDKQNSSVRKYIAQRADLLGAIRLPDTAFKDNANTQVTTDILFLQKRDRMVDIEPDWVHLGVTADNVPINSYYVEHPEMVLGTMSFENTMYGSDKDTACKPYPDSNLEELLDKAIANIHGEYKEYEVISESDEEINTIPADPNVRNFSYTLVADRLYFREDSVMTPVETSVTGAERIRGMIGIRDDVRNLITYQTEDYPDIIIKETQDELNVRYDKYTKKYGILNSRANRLAFQNDSSYSLLSSLEVLGDEGEFVRKADMFSRRTIRPHIVVTSVDTSSEALVLSIAEKAHVDLEYMSQLTGKTGDTLISELEGVIFLNVGGARNQSEKYVTVDEYLSGNVREKLKKARAANEALGDNSLAVNIKVLEKVQPKDLTATEINVRLGSMWIPVEIYEQFMYELLDTPSYAKERIKVQYSKHTNVWNISSKSNDITNVKANTSYGTKRASAYKLIEDSLNLRTTRIFDVKEEKRELNKKETAIAQSKQELIKTEFQQWVWKDSERRGRLTKMYNEQFNSVRPREYDGSHITFSGINPEITLREHQVNAIAHVLYGGNTLLAHVVGAGKTFEMIAAAMESKRLGLCHKSLVVVPNHITEQWASDWYQLYPSANILVATKKDFETKKRKRFCARIATGDYDAIIIGHSQFEKIPMSAERQWAILNNQIDEIINGIDEIKRLGGENFSVKQMERTRKSLQSRLDSLNDRSTKDDVVSFEELGVDRLFVDEAHGFKNMFLATKMRNVAGISQTEAKKSSDLFMKCQYLDEITGDRGVVFATGTPISNSMVELFTMQRYLQYNKLVENGLQHFDSWASTFGETVNAIELSPEGTGFRQKTRFARFHNLPELMNMFKEVADIKTADTLALDVPKANFHIEVIPPSDIQKDMVASLAERAEQVRNRLVEPDQDNMLLITNDGRKLALDQRLINGMLPFDENGKIATCAKNVFNIWEKTKADRLAQIVFCDLSTPKSDGSFNFYSEIKSFLMTKGIPEEEISFIHDAKTELQKKTMFAKVRCGQIRVIIGSTAKLGAGTNIRATVRVA